MSHARSFVFDGYGIDADKRTLRFAYRIDFDAEPSIHFKEHLTLPVEISQNSDAITKLIAALHIGLGMSYFKLFMPPNFELNDRELSANEAGFWNFVYTNGLGEFLYTNRLDPAHLAKFKASTISDNASSSAKNESALLALGGGKDSIVAGELLKKVGIDTTGFVLGTENNNGQTANVAKTMGLDLLAIERRLDPMLLELNTRSDVYNGHIPISMVFALSGLLLCAITQKSCLVVGNESSASVANTRWHDMPVNHQWSKSFEFEKALQSFIHTTISPDLWYFSAIRPLSSVAIAKIFSQYPQYTSVFTSCNRVFTIDPAKRPNNRWCGVCDKCLSSYIIMAPWLKEDELISIFDKNMMKDSARSVQLLALTGLEGHKPLDCVGTDEEIILSLNLIFEQGKFINTHLMHLAKERGIIRMADWSSKLKVALTITDEHKFPPYLSKKLLKTMKESML